MTSKSLLGNDSERPAGISGNEGKVILLGDVDHIKAYVYDTSKLPEIRGASEILNRLNEEGIRDLVKKKGLKEDECVIYSSGGGFMLMVPEDIANRLKAEIENMYLRETGICTISIVTSKPIGDYAVPNGGARPASDLARWIAASCEREQGEAGDFAHIVSTASVRLREKKLAKENVPFLPSLPFVKRCQHCGRKPATEVLKMEGDEKVVCSICFSKRQGGARAGKQKFLDQFAVWLDEKGQAPGLREKLGEDAWAPMHLGQLGEYVAFFYADGNDIGSLLERARSVEDYRRLSMELNRITRDALFGAMGEVIVPDASGRWPAFAPFEIINIGGDDVVLIVSARYCWGLACRFLDLFEQEAQGLATELRADKVTASVGMLISRNSYPVSYMRELASSLLKLAKRRSRAESEGALCHLFLTSQLASTDADLVIKDAYLHRQPATALTMRPYLRSEARKLLELSGEFAELFSRSQRSGFAEAMRNGMQQSTLFFLYQAARLPKVRRQRAFQLLSDMGTEFGLGSMDLFRKGGLPSGMVLEVDNATPFMDMLEILEFTKKGGGLA